MISWPWAPGRGRRVIRRVPRLDGTSALVGGDAGHPGKDGRAMAVPIFHPTDSKQAHVAVVGSGA